MVAPKTALATAADLLTIEDGFRAEVVRGMIVERASPSAEHSNAQVSMGGALVRRFQRVPGGRWPGGWWFGTEAEVEHESHEVFVHDVAAWRRERVPERPTGRPIPLRPDWVCELVSPSNAKRDHVDKFQTLHAHEVPHYWIADPIAQTLIVYRWQPQGYLAALTAAAGSVVRAEPFESVELRVSALLGLEDDDE